MLFSQLWCLQRAAVCHVAVVVCCWCVFRHLARYCGLASGIDWGYCRVIVQCACVLSDSCVVVCVLCVRQSMVHPRLPSAAGEARLTLTLPCVCGSRATSLPAPWRVASVYADKWAHCSCRCSFLCEQLHSVLPPGNNLCWFCLQRSSKKQQLTIDDLASQMLACVLYL